MLTSKTESNINFLSLPKVNSRAVGYYYCVKMALLEERFNGSIRQIEHRHKVFDKLFYAGVAARIYLFVVGNLNLK